MATENPKVAEFWGDSGKSSIRNMTDSEVSASKPTLTALKNQAINSVYDHCAAIRLKIAGTSDQVKIASWSNYRIIAENFASGSASDSDLAAIDAEINLRGLGETRQSFVTKIEANSARYSSACGIVTGAERKATDRITAAVAESDIQTILQDFYKDLSVLG